MESRLAQLAALSQRDKLPAYSAVLTELLLSGTDKTTLFSDIHILVDHVVNQESVGLVVGRQILTDLTKALNDKVIPDPSRREIVKDTLDIVQHRMVSYEEQVNSLRFQLADIYEAEEEWTEAARVLMGLSMDSGARYVLLYMSLKTKPLRLIHTKIAIGRGKATGVCPYCSSFPRRRRFCTSGDFLQPCSPSGSHHHR